MFKNNQERLDIILRMAERLERNVQVVSNALAMCKMAGDTIDPAVVDTLDHVRASTLSFTSALRDVHRREGQTS